MTRLWNWFLRLRRARPAASQRLNVRLIAIHVAAAGPKSALR
jgi:hypothetical protein